MLLCFYSQSTCFILLIICCNSDYIALQLSGCISLLGLHMCPWDISAGLGVGSQHSHLCIWGCTAYVLIQRDKRPLGSLGAHMAKCIFIGYPQGFKGWKFYNPLTRQVLILEHANFDEHFFMNQKHSAPYLPSSHPESLLESLFPPTHFPIILDSALDDCKELECS